MKVLTLLKSLISKKGLGELNGLPGSGLGRTITGSIDLWNEGRKLRAASKLLFYIVGVAATIYFVHKGYSVEEIELINQSINTK